MPWKVWSKKKWALFLIIAFGLSVISGSFCIFQDSVVKMFSKMYLLVKVLDLL